MADHNPETPRRVGKLLVLESGSRTVVEFASEQLDDWLAADASRKQLLELLDEHACDTLVFDLTGMEYLSSSWLELLIAPVRQGVRVCLCNVSAHLQSILQRTRLDQLVEIHARGLPADGQSSEREAPIQ